jgi:hypothetical protein
VSRIVTLAAAIGTTALVACTATHGWAAGTAAKIDITENEVGAPPADFEFLRTGGGELGRWTTVRDTSATEGIAIEHVSVDPHENRYPLAIYTPLSSKNVEISVRFKIIKGTMRTAGIAARYQNIDNYYVVSASALEERVDLFRVLNGKLERIWGTDADVGPYHWHTLGLVADHDQLTVSLDKKWLFTARDRTFLADGQIGLWTEEDNTTRFDQLEVRALPWSEER